MTTKNYLKLSFMILLFTTVSCGGDVNEDSGGNDDNNPSIFAGTLDESFNIGTGFDNTVNVIARQSDGKILVGGTFNKFNGQTSRCLVRLNSNGSFDASFIGTEFSGSTLGVSSIALQPDGKILVGGHFTKFKEITQNKLVRLNANGSLDTSFNIGTGFNNGFVDVIVVQPDGKILVGGSFNQFNGQTQNSLVRLNSNGSLDTSFNIGTGFNVAVFSIVLQSDGKILVGGQFTEYNGQTQKRLVRLNSNGGLDTSFDIGTGFSSGNVITVAVQPEGKILAGGNFAEYNGQSRNKFVRLNSNGSIDTSFDIGTGFGIGSGSNFSSSVSSIVLQPDGKILVGGGFLEYNVQTQKNLARLNSNGSLDTSFTIEVGFNSRVSSIILQPDGKILAGGNFTEYNGQPQNRLVRLHN